MKDISVFIKMLRVKQWAKNGLVFFPLIIFPSAISLQNIYFLLITFALFCTSASMVYIVNDWSDRKADALHHTKKLRPFASGELTLSDALKSLSVLFILFLYLSWIALDTSHEMVFLVVFYVIQSFLYSFYLKNITLLEMLIVSTGYSYRALAGGLAVALLPSTWMLATIFLASIFMVAQKRLSDKMSASNKDDVRDSIRAYPDGFLNLITGIAAAAAIVSFILFTLSSYAQAKFLNPYLPLSSLFIIFATFRYLQIVMGSLSGGDPILLIIRDMHMKVCIILFIVFITITNAI